MKVTIVGSGDAFGTGGRAHTCFCVESGAATVLVDFGAASLPAWHARGRNIDAVDAIVITHLHGDHFGGLPFLLLECQFVSKRVKPLRIAGPPGLAARLDTVFDAMFPGAAANRWTFPLEIQEIPPGSALKVAGLALETFEVEHPSGAPATAVRLGDGTHSFAYSGDTGWTDILVTLAAGVDLLAVECSSGEAPIPHHMAWPDLAAHLPLMSAKRIVVTHMGPTALARQADMEAAGLTIGYDGQSFDL
jgi:ribonuclease BN (tRNA processing enzyme)